MARATKATKTRQTEARLSSQVQRALREGALYLFGALALILWFALFTYNPADPGFSQATTSVEIQNGALGAMNAAIMFALLAPPPFMTDAALWFIGILGAVVSVYSGKSHPGKR